MPEGWCNMIQTLEDQKWLLFYYASPANVPPLNNINVIISLNMKRWPLTRLWVQVKSLQSKTSDKTVIKQDKVNLLNKQSNVKQSKYVDVKVKKQPYIKLRIVIRNQSQNLAKNLNK